MWSFLEMLESVTPFYDKEKPVEIFKLNKKFRYLECVEILCTRKIKKSSQIREQWK